MESGGEPKDLQWLIQAIRFEGLNLQSVSLYSSQHATSCYQDTESSMNINISRDSGTDFTDVVALLGSSNGISSLLRNLEFDSVVWETEWMKQLGFLLDNNRNIKQLVFKRNRFAAEAFSVLCEILRRNGVVKEVIFDESDIGSHGGLLLASALKVNETLEELQIWEDSIGSKGAEELAMMIEVNSALKLLTVFDSNSITASPVISAVLARNRTVEVHLWCAENGEKASKVAECVPENNTLRIYKLNVSGLCRVACALGMNTTIKVMDMTGVRLKSKWAKEFRSALEQNRSLREVILSKTCLKDKAVVHVAAGLFKNRTVQSLLLDGNMFGGIGVEHLLCPLSRFSALQLQANVTLRSVTFGGPKTKIGRLGLAAILQMLNTNQTVTHLGIHDDRSLRPNDFIKIFKTMERNASLRRLSLPGCGGIAGDSVADAIMETLQVNPWIEFLDLSRTPLHNAGMVEAIYEKLGQNGMEEQPEPDLDLLKDMPMAAPSSCRLFLCGQDYAGKRTLCNSVYNHFTASKSLYAERVRTLLHPAEQAMKPGGMQIKTINDNDLRIAIWNLPGQHELYPLQDLMFPGHGSSSLFFIVLSLFRKPNHKDLKNPGEVKEDIQYWLRLIVSNSRRGHGKSQLMLPNVTIVLTHFDKVNQPLQNSQMQNIVEAIQRLRDGFQGFVDFYPTVYTIDARSHASVSKLTYHIQAASKTILQRVPRVYDLCSDLIQIMSDWRAENCNKPVMRWREFCDLCQIKVLPLRIRTRQDGGKMAEMRRRAIATCLHELGELIYFQELGFLILDLEWFCSEVISQIINLDVRKQGWISKTELEKILKKKLQSNIPGMSSKVFENFEARDVVAIMLKLELCYLQDSSDPNSHLLMPAFLEDGRGKSPRWNLSAPDCVYAGRHFESDDSSPVVLTFGSFSRLQVDLHNKIIGTSNQHGATYSLEKYLMALSINGIHIRVELSGPLGYHIDILACSTKSLSETLKLVQQIIIPSIHRCCHGVMLTENIIRPECVRNLTPPRHRKSQSVAIHTLRLALLTIPADNIYEYKHTWSEVLDGNTGRLVLRSGFDFARDILSDDDFREVLNTRYHDLHNLAIELQVPENTIDQSDEPEGIIAATLAGVAKGVEQVLQRLKLIEQEIRDIKQEIQGLRYYEHRLLLELSRKVGYLVNYNFQLEERKVPNMFYFVQTENYSRKLVTRMVSGMNAVRLHMLCEFRGEMHVVEDQIGCEVMQVDNKAVQQLAPYTKKFMKLLTLALKIGAHLAAGMGEMIPDLSKEVAHLADSSLIYGAAGAVAAGTVIGAGAVKVRGRNMGDGSRDIQQEQRTAQQWVVDFLRDKRCDSGRDIAEKFGLWRVRYRDDGRIAWICRRHMNTRAHEIVEVPL